MAGVLQAWALCAILLPVNIHPTDPEELKSKFLKQYEPGVQPLIEFYENIRIRCRYVSRSYRDPADRWEQEKIYYAKAPYFRVDEVRLTEGPTKGLFTALVARPLGVSFSVGLSPGQKRYELLHATTDYAFKLEAIRQSALAPSWLYCKGNVPLTEVVKEPGFTVTSFGSVDRPGEFLARIEYEHRLEEPSPGVTYSGWIIFAPQQCWAIRESCEGIKGTERKGVRQITYEGSVQGVPLLKHILLTTQGPPDASGGETSIEVLELIPGPVPEEEFTLAAFGLSDAGLQATVPPWFYYQLIALLAAAAALLFWRLARRRRAHGPAEPS
jgi:hypothetical protein